MEKGKLMNSRSKKLSTNKKNQKKSVQLQLSETRFLKNGYVGTQTTQESGREHILVCFNLAFSSKNQTIHPDIGSERSPKPVFCYVYLCVFAKAVNTEPQPRVTLRRKNGPRVSMRPVVILSTKSINNMFLLSDNSIRIHKSLVLNSLFLSPLCSPLSSGHS